MMDLEERREGKLSSGCKINKEIKGKVWFCHNCKFRSFLWWLILIGVHLGDKSVGVSIKVFLHRVQ